jgi:hypothetical protein
MVKDKKNGDSDFGLPEIEAKLNKSGNKKRRFTVFLLVFLSLGASIWAYWWYYGNKSSEKLRTDLVHKFEDVVNDVQEDEVLPVVKEEPEIKPKEGTITFLKAPQGLYYVVFNSFVDNDLALDYARILKKDGLSVHIIEPNKAKQLNYYYVCVYPSASFADAEESIKTLVSAYNRSDFWTLKY